MPTLKDALKGIKPAPTPPPRNAGPVWKGPEEDGVTYSLMSRFLTCRRRFALMAVDGLRAEEKFDHKIEFGNMWHVCEEHHARNEDWAGPLKDYAAKMMDKYKLQQEQVHHWYGVCRTQFPLYATYWETHPDVANRKPLYAEQVFDVPYKLPWSGRVVRLRGKWDGADLVKSGPESAIYFKEHKTKSRIDEIALPRQLTFDLQSMTYLAAFREYARNNPVRDGARKKGAGPSVPIKGMIYNVVRRTEHRLGKKETEQQFRDRLAGIIAENPGEWFYRWKVEVSTADLNKFLDDFLHPFLEHLCVWWDGVTGDRRPVGPWFAEKAMTWRHPFGVRNILDEGGHTDTDNYLATGSTIGLYRTEELFPELKV